MTPVEIKNKGFEDKVTYFRHLLSNLDNDNEVDILNLFRLVNSYNVFDEKFFEQETSYINDISEFIDIKSELAEELQSFMETLVTWYLSLIASCEIPLTVEQDENKVKIPATIYGIFTLGSISLMASIMGKVDMTKIDMGNLYKVKEGFAVISRLFQNHAIVNSFLEKI